MDWFLYDNGLRHERVNPSRAVHFRSIKIQILKKLKFLFSHFFAVPQKVL